MYVTCVRDTESQRLRVVVYERDRETESARWCVQFCSRKTKRVREREHVCVCICVWCVRDTHNLARECCHVCVRERAR